MTAKSPVLIKFCLDPAGAVIHRTGDYLFVKTSLQQDVKSERTAV
jgi:hypothetical protein